AKRFSYELGSSGLSSRVDQLVFSFGGLGQVQHQGGKVSGESLEQLESACLTRIIGAGRPFSFHFARALDRLAAVECRFPNAAVTRETAQPRHPTSGGGAGAFTPAATPPDSATPSPSACAPAPGSAPWRRSRRCRPGRRRWPGR